MSAFPVYKSISAIPISPSIAHSYLSIFLDACASKPYLLPNAKLEPTGPVAGIARAGIVIHNLRKVELGLRGVLVTGALEEEVLSPENCAVLEADSHGFARNIGATDTLDDGIDQSLTGRPVDGRGICVDSRNSVHSPTRAGEWQEMEQYQREQSINGGDIIDEQEMEGGHVVDAVDITLSDVEKKRPRGRGKQEGTRIQEAKFNTVQDLKMNPRSQGYGERREVNFETTQLSSQKEVGVQNMGPQTSSARRKGSKKLLKRDHTEYDSENGTLSRLSDRTKREHHRASGSNAVDHDSMTGTSLRKGGMLWDSRAVDEHSQKLFDPEKQDLAQKQRTRLGTRDKVTPISPNRGTFYDKSIDLPSTKGAAKSSRGPKNSEDCGDLTAVRGSSQTPEVCYSKTKQVSSNAGSLSAGTIKGKRKHVEVESSPATDATPVKSKQGRLGPEQHVGTASVAERSLEARQERDAERMEKQEKRKKREAKRQKKAENKAKAVS